MAGPGSRGTYDKSNSKKSAKAAKAGSAAEQAPGTAPVEQALAAAEGRATTA